MCGGVASQSMYRSIRMNSMLGGNLTAKCCLSYGIIANSNIY